jgi:outer membrane lipoprotein SlyB
MQLLTVTTLLFGTLLVQGCGTPESAFGREPIVDMAGVDQRTFNADMAECRSLADQVQTGRQTATGAATGAVVGGVLGAVVGNRGTAATAAGVGGVVGGVGSGGNALAERQRVLRNCLANRGYRILN